MIARYFGIPGAHEYTFPLYTLGDARILRDHLSRRLEEIDARPERIDDGTLTFVVVGGGPTGVEVAGALAELLDVSVRHDGFKFDRAGAKIIVVDGLDRLLTPFKPSASSYAADTLRRRTVELRLGRMVRRVTPTCVELDDGTEISTRTVVWAGGVTVDGTWLRASGSRPTGPVAWWSGPTSPSPTTTSPTPSATPPRFPGGRTDRGPPARNSPRSPSSRAGMPPIRSSTGWPGSRPWRSATTTRGRWPPSGGGPPSPSSPSGVVIRGTLGWLSWLGLHLVYLIGFRNRLTVLVNWSWRYLSWTSGPRIIVGEDMPANLDANNKAAVETEERQPETVDSSP